VTTLAISFEAFGAADFWIGVGVIAAIYGIFALGLQLNAGLTGIFNFGQAGFMAIGAYSMGILVVKAGWPLWAALPVASLIAMCAGVLIGLPSLRLRADYFAIATISFSEVVRYVAQNARGLTGGNQGLLGFDDDWIVASDWFLSWLDDLGLGHLFLLPLLIVAVATFVVLAIVMRLLKGTPWGRVLRAVREDEDAARALGKNVFVYKLQSLAIAAILGSIAGYLLALNLAFLVPESFEPSFTFVGYVVVILGGLGSYLGVAFGTVILWILLEGTRFLDLPLSDEKIAAIRFMIVGLALILLVTLRPQGVLGKRDEMVLRD
jgi:branched-chain amino acid transport system permease protein